MRFLDKIKDKLEEKTRLWLILTNGSILFSVAFWIAWPVFCLFIQFYFTIIVILLCLVIGGISVSGGQKRRSSLGYYWTEPKGSSGVAFAITIPLFMLLTCFYVNAYASIIFFTGIVTAVILYKKLDKRE